MNEVRCPYCNQLSCKVVFGLVEAKCFKCNKVFTQRFDVYETARLMPTVKNTVSGDDIIHIEPLEGQHIKQTTDGN
jgi:phage FluMu protein Com